MKQHFACCFFLLLACSPLLLAQDSTAARGQITRYLEIGTSANAYRGDLSETYNKWSGSLQLGLKLNFKKRLNGHFNLSYGTLTGQNPNYQYAQSDTATPNRFFKTSLLTVNYDLQVNLIKTKSWLLYVSQGLGLVRFKPRNEDNDVLETQFNSRALDETYNTVSLILPTQIGASYFFSNGFGVNVQTGWLNPRTDYLDNISLWGNRSRRDNAMWLRFAFLVPVSRRE